jgi:hypothetical protein
MKSMIAVEPGHPYASQHSNQLAKRLERMDVVAFLAVTVLVGPANAPIGVKTTGEDCFSRNFRRTRHLLSDPRVRRCENDQFGREALDRENAFELFMQIMNDPD